MRGRYALVFFFVAAVQIALGASTVKALPSKPTSVVLYPKGGWVQVSEKIVPRDNKIYFELPAGARLETLQVNIDGQYIGNIETKPIVAAEGPAVAKLREQYKNVVKEVAGIKGKLAAIKAKIALWSKPEWVNSSVEDMKRLDNIIGPKLEELHVAEAAILPELSQAEFRLKMAEDALKDVGGESQQAIGVVAFVQRKEASKGGTVDVQYGYMLQNCGWNPRYQINAVPEENVVEIKQNAELYQASGQDWSDVEVTLASVDVGEVLGPPALFPWIIRPMPENQPYRSLAKVASEPRLTADLPMAKEEASFTTWNLGKISIIAGVGAQVPLYKGDWKADFFRLLRPALQDQAYLAATARVPEGVDLLPGVGQFTVNGKVVGSGRFNFSNNGFIFFGVDSQVTARMYLDKSQSGRGSFIDRKQSHIWSWNISVMNEHSKPIKVIVEDPAPQSRDSGIEVTAQSVPPATIKEHNYVWDLTIPAKSKQLIRHKVVMTAPNDIQIPESR